MSSALGDQPLSRMSRLVVLGFILAAALALRVYRITEPPLEFHPTRQYRSVTLARGCYYKFTASIPAWRRQMGILNAEAVGFLEPPIMETLTCIGYGMLGGEHIWLPRLLASIFWLAGGLCLRWCAQRIASKEAALGAMIFYLFVPFGITASRVFMPDPLMVLSILFALVMILRYDDTQSASRLVAAATASAAALFVKPYAIFSIFAVFLSMTLARDGVRRAATDARVLAFGVISVLPLIGRTFYGLLIAGYLRGGAHAVLGGVMPWLLREPFFWKGWVYMAGGAVGYASLAAALVGVFMAPHGRPRALLIGLCVGYALFGITFTYQIHTHNYYHLQLIPIVALCLCPIADAAAHRLGPRYSAFGALAVFLVAVALVVPRSAPARDHQAEIVVAQEIGEAVGHHQRTIFLAPWYGVPLRYHGELSGTNWPQAGDFRAARLGGASVPSAQERFAEMQRRSPAEYFIVISLAEFDAQPDLKRLLTTNFPVLVATKDYAIFDLRTKLPPQ